MSFLFGRSSLVSWRGGPRKDNIDGEAITYEKKRDLAEYMITLHECQQISNFVYQGKFQLMSVLWLLSEFARIKFCKGRE